MTGAFPKPIPTEFAGVTFRSRLEARWAVFLSSLGVSWVYEAEGFELHDGRYLPDFWLPTLSTFLEIKPDEPPPDARAKCAALAAISRRRVILFPWEPGAWLRGESYGCPSPPSECYRPSGDEAEGDTDYLPCLCPKCGAFGIEFAGWGTRVCGDRCFAVAEKIANFDAPKIVEAVQASKPTLWNAPMVTL